MFVKWTNEDNKSRTRSVILNMPWRHVFAVGPVWMYVSFHFARKAEIKKSLTLQVWLRAPLNYRRSLTDAVRSLAQLWLTATDLLSILFIYLFAWLV
jgi:hypothetical protein